MSPVGFEPTSAGERPKTYALDRAATGTGTLDEYVPIFVIIFQSVLLRITLYELKFCP